MFNRGNYRRDLFRVHRTGEVFREALFESCLRFGWVLHAYVVMSNHYHLALETPKGKLSKGMQYLQSVFSNRFNKFVGERGHVFEGRYKALLLEDSVALLQVVDYIHLNPVNAGIVELDQLKSYRLSSFPEFCRRKGRPEFLNSEEFLNEAGGLSDSAAGMGAYHRRLKYVMEEDPEERNRQFEELCRGWYVGTKEGQAALAGQIQNGKAKANAAALNELEEERWTRLLKIGMKSLGKTGGDIRRDKKSADWKLALGAWVKSRSAVPNRWLSEHLNMGHSQNASKQMCDYVRSQLKKCPHARVLERTPKNEA